MSKKYRDYLTQQRNEKEWADRLAGVPAKIPGLRQPMPELLSKMLKGKAKKK